jgi:hypothetical protein
MRSNSDERTRFDRSTSLLVVFGSAPLCAASAHLANDCFRDLDGLGADDSYGDNPIVPIRVLPAAGTCAMSSRALGSLRCFPRPISVKRVPGALAEAAAAASASSLSAAPARPPLQGPVRGVQGTAAVMDLDSAA